MFQVDKTLIMNLKAPYKTKCGSLELKYFKKYSYDACWLEQLTEYVEQSCHCKESFMPGDTIPICNGPQVSENNRFRNSQRYDSLPI